MAGYIEDRWLTKRPNPETGKRERTDRWGKGKRYKVTGIPGVRARSFGTADDAKKWLKSAATDADRGEFVDPRLGTITLADYIATHFWPGRKDKPSTHGPMVSRIKNHILPLPIGSTALNKINASALRAFKVELLTRVAPTTAAVIWTHLASILEQAVEDGRLLRNPCTVNRKLKPSSAKTHKARALERSQVEAIRAHVQARYRVAVDLGVGCGLRQGEVLGLGLADVDFEAGLVRIERQLRWDNHGRPYFSLPKGDKTRTVPLPPQLADRVREAVSAYPPVPTELPWSDPEPPVTELEKRQRKPITVALLFTSSAGKRINPRTWNTRTWKPALEKAGLITSKPGPDNGSKVRKYEDSRELGFHALRHTFASVQLEAGESVVTLAAWLGHSSPTVTMEHYAHFMPGAGARGLAAMDGWFAPPAPILPQHSPGAFLISPNVIAQHVKGMIIGKPDMKVKYKETSRGGLAVNVIEC